MTSQNCYNPGDADGLEQFLSNRLTEAMSKREKPWWAQLANRKGVLSRAFGEFKLSDTPITFKATAENCIPFYWESNYDISGDEAPLRKSFTVCAGYFEIRLEYNVNRQDPQAAICAVECLIGRLANAVATSQDRIVQAAMLGICRSELDHRDNRGSNLSEKACSPFILHINDITKQCIKPVSRIFVTGLGVAGTERVGTENVSFCEYKKPKDSAVPTPADDAIKELAAHVDDRLTLDILRSIWDYTKICINRKEYPFKKAIGPGCTMVNKCITVLVNRYVLEDMIEEKYPHFSESLAGLNTRLQNAQPGILLSEFYLVPCDDLPIYENANGNLVGVAAILGEGSLVVLHNNDGQNGTGFRVIDCGKGIWKIRYPFGCLRPAFRRKNENHRTDCGVMLIHHGMGRAAK